MTEKAEHASGDTRRRPSLASSSGHRPTEFLPLAAWWLVRSLEPIGYVAAAAVGFGLWILFGDYLTALSDVLTVAVLLASAAALWWAAWVVGSYPFAETWRLGNAIYAAAIGTTGWIAWVATERVLEADVRFTVTVGLVAVCSYLVQRIRGDLVTWTLLIAGMFATAIAAGVTIADSTEGQAAGLAFGALAAGAGAYLLAGRATRARYQPTTLIVLSVTLLALLAGFGLPTAFGIGIAVAGFGAALAAYFATRPATQLGKISAATDTTLALLVVLAKIEVRLSVVLIVAGSVVLALLGWAAKRVFGSSPDIAPADAPADVTTDTATTARHDPPVLDTTSMPAVATDAPQKTNGLAIASLILGITWIFWVGSLFAVVFGHIALSQTEDSSGRGMAIAGLVLGYTALGVAALIAVVLLVDPGI